MISSQRRYPEGTWWEGFKWAEQMVKKNGTEWVADALLRSRMLHMAADDGASDYLALLIQRRLNIVEYRETADMTTVACNLEGMASDLFFTDGRRAKKIFTYEDGLIGITGDGYQATKFVTWLQEGQRGPVPILEGEKVDECTLLILRHDGIFTMHGHGILLPCDRPFWAEGSGMEYAQAAMFIGRTPPEAVEVAAEFDPNTKLPAVWVPLPKRRRKTRR